MLHTVKERFLLFRIRRYQDHEAFRQIYDHYRPPILRYLSHKLPSVQDTEDALAELFLETWQYLTSGVIVGNLRALLYKIARNHVTAYYRDREKRGGGDIELNEATATVTMDEEVPDVFSLEAVKLWVKTLSGDYHDVVFMRYFEELSIREISEIIGKTENNTRVILHRALSILRERYGNQSSDRAADGPTT